MKPNLRYTMCFLRKGDRVLLLNRDKAPNMGLWNGPGGKLDPGETALECAKREFFEETGLDFSNARFAGIVTWDSEAGCSGMYLFSADAPADLEYQTPRKTDEGLLDWKELSWILHKENAGIAPHVKQILKTVLDDPTLYEHRFVFRNNELVGSQTLPLETAILS